MALGDVDDDDHDKLAKAADKKSEKFTKCFEYGTMIKPSDVAKLFVIFFSILADIGREAVDAFVHANSLTYRVPFAAIMGTDRYSTAPDSSFKLRGDPKVPNEEFTTFFQQADFGTGVTTWKELSATVGTGLQTILRTSFRILFGLLDHEGALFDAIKHLGEYAVLEALSVIAIRYHIVTPATVGSLWSVFLTISYIPGSDMLEFLTLIEDTARTLCCDGKALTIPRPGPTSRDVLQLMVDAIRATDARTFAMDIAKGDDLLGEQSVSANTVQLFRQRLITTSLAIYGAGKRTGEAVMSVYALICPSCGGRGHLKEQCPSARIVSPPGDTGMTPPDPSKDRKWTARDRTDGSNGGKKREKREWTGKWEEWMSLCKFCQAKHLHKDCPTDEAVAAKAANDKARAAAGNRPAAMTEYDTTGASCSAPCSGARATRTRTRPSTRCKAAHSAWRCARPPATTRR